MIAIPLFVDQPMNALLAEKRHFGILLQKSQVSEEALKEAIKTLTEDERYEIYQIVIILQKNFLKEHSGQ